MDSLVTSSSAWSSEARSILVNAHHPSTRVAGPVCAPQVRGRVVRHQLSGPRDQMIQRGIVAILHISVRVHRQAAQVTCPVVALIDRKSVRQVDPMTPAVEFRIRHRVPREVQLRQIRTTAGTELTATIAHIVLTRHERCAARLADTVNSSARSTYRITSRRTFMAVASLLRRLGTGAKRTAASAFVATRRSMPTSTRVTRRFALGETRLRAPQKLATNSTGQVRYSSHVDSNPVGHGPGSVTALARVFNVSILVETARSVVKRADDRP